MLPWVNSDDNKHLWSWSISFLRNWELGLYPNCLSLCLKIDPTGSPEQLVGFSQLITVRTRSFWRAQGSYTSPFLIGRADGIQVNTGKFKNQESSQLYWKAARSIRRSHHYSPIPDSVPGSRTSLWTQTCGLGGKRTSVLRRAKSLHSLLGPLNLVTAWASPAMGLFQTWLEFTFL